MGSTRVPVLRYQDVDGSEIWLPESDSIITKLADIGSTEPPKVTSDFTD